MLLTHPRPSPNRCDGTEKVDAEDRRTVDQLTDEIDGLRERLSKFAETRVRINESLGFDAGLQSVLDPDRSLTSAR